MDHHGLTQFITEKKLPWITYNYQTARFILVVDNHLLSTYRSCPAAFFEQHVEGYHPKPGYNVPNEKRWYLDFGLVFHRMMEVYYRDFRKTGFDELHWASDFAYEIWTQKNLDIYSLHPEYHSIGGFKGFVGLLLQYAHRFKPENEKLRILDTEVAFGKNKEILLYSDEFVEVYLAGRMDVIVDDGFYIMPMDHKTAGSFRRDPLERYLLDEGPTGYIYSLKYVLPKIVPVDLLVKRDCTRILMNLISKSVPKDNPMDRFRRLPILKTENQLITYRQRMLITCKHLFEDIISYMNGGQVFRDTSHCTDWFHGICPFYDVHRQADVSAEQATLANGFVRLPIWDTENISLS